MFSNIARPVYRLLEKDTKFDFDEACKTTFEDIRARFLIAPIIVAQDWHKNFEIMCDASDFSMGVVSRQRVEKTFKAIYYKELFNYKE